MNKIILTKDDVLRAQKHTLSNRAAARYLGVSYNVYKRYALTFNDNETGKTLFDKHLNRQGKGIKKHLGGYGKPKKNIKAPLEDVLEGRVDVSHYTVDILKSRLIQEGYLEECCSSCGFNERRVVDFTNFEEAFVQSIEALLEIAFNKNQNQIIQWWLYEKWNTGDESVLQLNNTETGEELPSDTPEELWNLIQSLK